MYAFLFPSDKSLGYYLSPLPGLTKTRDLAFTFGREILQSMSV
jgi:hypothetical protein